MNKFGLIFFALMVIGGVAFFLLREDVPDLSINEFMAHNESCCPDMASGQPEYEDWIEIYNGGKVAVDIGGMYFSQNKKEPLGFHIPDSDPSLTTIQPGGFLVVWADDAPAQGTLHLKFKLDQDGEYVGLFDKNGRTVDGLKFGTQHGNISYGRSPDGGTTWKEFSTPTPGRSNN